MSEQRRWTLWSGWTGISGDGPAIAEKSIEVCPVSELDAALAERDALKASLDDSDSMHAMITHDNAALRDELAEVRAKAQTMGSRLRQWAEREQECISAACAFNDPASPGHSPDCPAAPDFLTKKDGA